MDKVYAVQEVFTAETMRKRTKKASEIKEKEIISDMTNYVKNRIKTAADLGKFNTTVYFEDWFFGYSALGGISAFPQEKLKGMLRVIAFHYTKMGFIVAEEAKNKDHFRITWEEEEK